MPVITGMEGDAMTAPVSAEPRPGQDEAQPEPPGEPDRQRPALRPWAVVAIWAVLLGLLVAMGAGFGNNPFVLEVSGSSAGFVLLLAGAVWLDRRLRPRRGYLRQPTRVGGVVLFAVAVMLAWLGLAFGAWLTMVAAVPFIAALGLEVAAHRRGKTA
jgi:hypothetical protein